MRITLIIALLALSACGCVARGTRTLGVSMGPNGLIWTDTCQGINPGDECSVKVDAAFLTWWIEYLRVKQEVKPPTPEPEPIP